MIEVRNLTKRYGPNTAVDNISFDIEPGRIYGLLGPNGAGKSTTMNIITGCLAATEGTVRVNGYDIFEQPLEAKRCIGYLPEIPPLYTDMTPYEYLMFVAEAKGVEYEATFRQVREVMELTELEDVRDRLIRNLSKGYRQRVGIAQAMLGNPDIIILDEPTVGLDPKQIIEIRDLIRTLGENKTVILSSHILAEVSAVCENVIIISHGNIVANDTLANLNSRVSPYDHLHISVRGDESAILAVLDGIDGIHTIETLACPEDGVHDYRLEVERDTDLRDTLFFAMAEKRCAMIAMEREVSSLESIFLALTDSVPEADPAADAEESDTLQADTANAPDDTSGSDISYDTAPDNSDCSGTADSDTKEDDK